MRNLTIPTLLLLAAAASLGACSSPNVRAPGSYAALRSSPVQHPDYDPYAPYAEANATWRPPVADRAGTIVKPLEPPSQAGRPDYEHAPWATGASGKDKFAPPGTF